MNKNITGFSLMFLFHRRVTNTSTLIPLRISGEKDEKVIRARVADPSGYLRNFIFEKATLKCICGYLAYVKEKKPKSECRKLQVPLGTCNRNLRNRRSSDLNETKLSQIATLTVSDPPPSICEVCNNAVPKLVDVWTSTEDLMTYIVPSVVHHSDSVTEDNFVNSKSNHNSNSSNVIPSVNEADTSTEAATIVNETQAESPYINFGIFDSVVSNGDVYEDPTKILDATVEGLTVEESAESLDATIEDATTEKVTVEDSTRILDATVEDPTKQAKILDATKEDATKDDPTKKANILEVTMEDMTMKEVTMEDMTLKEVTMEGVTMEDVTIEEATKEETKNDALNKTEECSVNNIEMQGETDGCNATEGPVELHLDILDTIAYERPPKQCIIEQCRNNA
jgi:hypothetical protein